MAITGESDAFAAGQHAGLGGVLRFPGKQQLWFSLQVTYAELKPFFHDVPSDLQKVISALELLAIAALILVASKMRARPLVTMSFQLPQIILARKQPQIEVTRRMVPWHGLLRLYVSSRSVLALRCA